MFRIIVTMLLAAALSSPASGCGRHHALQRGRAGDPERNVDH
jgi:hypothetical protein